MAASPEAPGSAPDPREARRLLRGQHRIIRNSASLLSERLGMAAALKVIAAL
jgi:hypothetical protein